MIVDKLRNASLYEGMGERIALGLEFLRSNDLPGMAPGKHEIRGSEVYAIVTQYDTKRLEASRWEAHRCYIDIQYIVQGCERLGYANVADLRVSEPYDGEKDALFLEGEGSFVTARPGTFILFGPEDAHMPGVALTSPGPVKKVIVKVRV